MSKIQWLKDCELCNAGVCNQMDEYKAGGMSERAASRQMEQDCQGQFTSEQIYSRYRYHAKGHTGGSVGNPHNEMEQVLRSLIVERFMEVCSPCSCNSECEIMKKVRGLFTSIGTDDLTTIYKSLFPEAPTNL